jgi:hypothetical protein
VGLFPHAMQFVKRKKKMIISPKLKETQYRKIIFKNIKNIIFNAKFSSFFLIIN